MDGYEQYLENKINGFRKRISKMYQKLCCKSLPCIKHDFILWYDNVLVIVNPFFSQFRINEISWRMRTRHIQITILLTIKSMMIKSKKRLNNLFQEYTVY